MRELGKIENYSKESMMELTLGTTPLAEIEAEAVILVAFTKEKPEAALPEGPVLRADQATGGLISDLYASGEFTGKALETALVHRPAGLRAARLLLVGGGDSAKFNPSE